MAAVWPTIGPDENTFTVLHIFFVLALARFHGSQPGWEHEACGRDSVETTCPWHLHFFCRCFVDVCIFYGRKKCHVSRAEPFFSQRSKSLYFFSGSPSWIMIIINILDSKTRGLMDPKIDRINYILMIVQHQYNHLGLLDSIIPTIINHPGIWTLLILVLFKNVASLNGKPRS